MTSIVDRLGEVLKTRNGYNGQDRIWRLPKRDQQIEFGSIPNMGDEQKYQGRPHDFLAFDEATNVFVQQVRFLTTWLRSAAGYRAEMLLTFNPPVSAEGRWVLPFFRPWLETEEAAPGEIRFFVTVEQKDIEVPDARPCVVVNKEPVFDFDPEEWDKDDIIAPQSRTFIPARVSDNTFLGRQYMAVLQGLPEPLRSQMLKGDFSAGIEDDAWQVIPTAWVKAAMDRWKQTPMPKKPPMTGLGVDIARGGRDNTIIARKHEGLWFDEPLVYPGSQTPDGHVAMALIIAAQRDGAPVQVDVVGVGSSPYDFLKIARFQVVGLNGGEKSNEKTQPGTQGFCNLKSQLWWRFREALDPAYNTGICLPPDEQLLKDLTAPIWEPEGSKIRVESRKAIIKRIGRSPDWGSAYVYALPETPRLNALRERADKDYDPFAIFSEGS